jgi:hypothetical protein
MESYRNTIEMNTQLIERQEVLHAALEKIVAHVEKLSANQTAITDLIKSIPEKIKTAADRNRQETLKEHHAHTMRLYGAFSVLAVIIISLLGLVSKIWPTQ